MPKFEKLTHCEKSLTERPFKSASEKNNKEQQKDLEEQQKDLNEIREIFTYWEWLEPEEERFQKSLILLVDKMNKYIQKYNIY